MFRLARTTRLAGSVALVLAVVSMGAKAFEGANNPRKLDPLAGARLWAERRAPAGQTAVPSDRYAAALKQAANLPLYSTADGGFPAPNATVIGTWTNLGPSNKGGRTRGLAVHPTLPDVWFAGGVAGGVFFSSDAGLNWATATPGGNTLNNLPVSAIAVKGGATLATTTLVAGTGEGFTNEDLVRGAGIYKSTNGGSTWAALSTTATSADFQYVNDLLWTVDGTTGVIYAATSTGVFRSNASATTEGTSWVAILRPAATVTGGCFDIVKANTATATDQLLVSCGNKTQATIYQVIDGRVAVAVTTPGSLGSFLASKTETDMGRTSLASNGSVTYALAAHKTTGALYKVFRSADGGTTWTDQAVAADGAPNSYLLSDGQSEECGAGGDHIGWYANAIAIDPSDGTGNTVWAGGYDLFRSTDGGNAWSPVSASWQEGQSHYLPAGIMNLVFTSTRTAIATEQGVYRLTTPPVAAGSYGACPNANVTTTAVYGSRNNGYAVAQFNSGAVAFNDTTYVGGTQSSGSQKGTDAGGPANWTRIWPEFGGAALIDPTDPNVIYISEKNGKLRKSTNGGTSFPDHPTSSDGYWTDGLSGTFSTVAPIAFDPSNPSRLYTAGPRVFRSDDGALTWTPVSTLFPTGVTATAIAVSPSNPDIVSVGTSNGTVFRTTAASSATGTTAWTANTVRSGANLSSLAFHPTEPNTVWATFTTFGGTTHVYRTLTGGTSWTSVGASIGDVPVNTVVVDPTNPLRVYVGTDIGVYVGTSTSPTTNPTWARENTGFPNVATEKLLVNGVNLYAFTHGRGVWRVALSDTATVAVGFEGQYTEVTEADTTLNFDVYLSTANHATLGSQVTVNWAAAPAATSGATEGADYTAASGTITFPAGSAHGSFATVQVPILDDNFGELDEKITLTLSGATGGALVGPSVHTVVINDDGDPPALFINDVTVAETTATATFTVTLTPSLGVPVTVAYTTANGTATAGVAPAGDYTTKSGTLTFAAGITSQTIPVTIRTTDTVAEPAETYFVNLSSPSGGGTVLGDSQGLGTITDNDVSGTVELSAATYTIAEATGAGNATITLKRTGGAASGVTVDYATSNGTATAGSDYTTKVGTLTFAASATTASFTVPVLVDTLDENDETVNITLSNVGGFGAALGAQTTAVLNITDNDVAGTFALSSATYSGVEGTSVVVTVKRTGGTASDVRVNYATSDGSAVAGGVVPNNDYTPASGTLTFASGELQKTVSVALLTETPLALEPAETFTFTLSNPANPNGPLPTLGTPAVATVTIDDASPKVSFSVASTTVSESLASVTLTVNRTGPTSTVVTVPYTMANGTASAGLDYTAASGTLTFAANVTTAKTIAVGLKVDTIVEGPENFTVSLGAPTGGVLGTNPTVTVNITDNDVAGTFAFSALTFPAQEPLNTTPFLATVTVKRTGGTASGVVVNWATDATGTAAPGTDFVAASGSLTFAANATSATFKVTVNPDADVEGQETIGLALTAGAGGGTPGTPVNAVINIIDSEPAVAFSAPTYSVSEGLASATITLKRTGVLTGAITVTVADIGGGATATPGVDYGVVPTSIAMASGAASKTFTVPVLGDVLPEANETVNLQVLSCTPGCMPGGQNTAQLTIVDDEPLVSFGAATYTTTEPNAATLFTITLKRTGNTTNALTVNLAQVLGSATNLSDYDQVPASVNIPAAATSATFKVRILPDLVPELAENFGLQITSVTGGGLPHPTLPTTTTITINDNEPTIAMSVPTLSKAEPLNTTTVPIKAVITVKRTGVLTQASSVDYAIAPSGANPATLAVDYNPLLPTPATSGTINFASGAGTATLTIDILADTSNESNETFTVTLSNGFQARLGTILVTTVTITDND